MNRKAMESLIKAGALDRFGERFTLLHNIDLLLAFAARLQKQANSGQTDLFGAQDSATTERPRLELIEPPSSQDQREQLVWERELLGLYLSQHPLELFETMLSEKTVSLNTLKAEHDGKSVTIGGAIADVREITTKSGQKMAFVKLEDQFGEIEVVLFPSSYQQTVGLWERDKVVLIRGKVNAKDKDGNATSDIKVMVDDAREITAEQANAYQATGKKPKTLKTRPPSIKNTNPSSALPRLYIRLTDSDDQKKLLTLKQTLDAYSGTTEVVLVLGEAATKQAIKLPGGIDHASEGYSLLETLVGADNLKMQ